MSAISSSRPAQNSQKKYYTDGSFRVFRAPVTSSLPYATASQMDPGYHSTRSDNRYYQTSYRDVSGPTTDDRSRTPRYFTDSERNFDNRKPAPDYSVYSRFPPDDYIYDRSVSPLPDIYSPDYEDHFSTPTSTYSLAVSDDASISMPELGSDHSDYSHPASPVDSGAQPMPIPSVPASSPSQQQAAYPINFRNHADPGYTTPRVPDTDPSFHPGSSDNTRLQTDSRRHPAFHQSRNGNLPPATVSTADEVPYAESVFSTESEDEVHRLAKINAEYNAATSALYGIQGRDARAGPILMPPVARMPPTAPPPRESTARQVYTDGPLTSSPTQIRYADELQRSVSYRSSDGRPVYSATSYRPTPSRSAVPPSRRPDEFLPPSKEWDDGRSPPTPWNSPQPPYESYSPTSRSRRTSERESDGNHSRPLPTPPTQTRPYNGSEGLPIAEKVIVLPRSPEGATEQMLPELRRVQQRTDAPETSQSKQGRRERRSSVSVQAEPATSVRSPPSSAEAVQYSSDEYDGGGMTRSSSTRKSKDKRRAAPADDAQRAPESTSSSSTSPPHEPRFIPPKTESSTPGRAQPLARHNSASLTQAPLEESRASGSRSARSPREGVDNTDQERTKKSSSSYDRTDRANRDERGADKSKSSRHQPTPRQEYTTRPPVPIPPPAEKPERRRKDSLAQPPSIPSEVPFVSPALVPIARPQPDPITHSYSRGGPPMATAESQGTSQRPNRRSSDDDRSPGTTGSYPSRRDAATGPGMAPNNTNPAYSSYAPHLSAVPEPQRRYSDGDVPPPPSFFAANATTRPSLPQPSTSAGARRTMPNPRTVRWDENLICPSPIPSSRRRDGWFNRRGDQLWTNDGLYMPAPAGQEYPPDLDDYPEYGEGWMNEKCVRIDMGHRLIPKTPLRPALKQSQPRS
ncbi:hypothetical protein APHAL10511_008065 [Amanita phalloides]|nr:hypothetical protein APHAL10511_008065 [Amanita phalloides]